MYQDVLCTMLFHSFHLFSRIYDIHAIQNLMPVVTRSGPDDPGASAAQHEKTQRRRNSLGSIRHVRIANGRANCLGARSRHHGGKRQKDIEITRTTVQSSSIAVLLGEKPFKNHVLHSEIPLRLLASLPVSGSTVCQVSSKQLWQMRIMKKCRCWMPHRWKPDQNKQNWPKLAGFKASKIVQPI